MTPCIIKRRPSWGTKMTLSKKTDQSGVTLVELLVALVITSLIGAAVFTFFLSTSEIIGNESEEAKMFTQGRSAMMFLRERIESAGYGVSLSVCPNGVLAENTAISSTPFSMFPIQAALQGSGTQYSYDPTSSSGINTYSLTTVSGGGTIADGVASSIVSIPSTSSDTMELQSGSLVNNNDLFVVELPDSYCLFGQVTGVSGNEVTFSSSSIYNPSGGFSSLNGTILASQFVNANFYVDGTASFYQNIFSIGNAGGEPDGLPTLYATQYSYNSSGPASPQAVARGIVDMQIEYGVSGGSSSGGLQEWVSPQDYNATTDGNIVDVQVGILARTTTPIEKANSPASYDILGQTFDIPSTNGQSEGCENGDCRDYLYHVFSETIPVRNEIWGNS